MASTPASRPHHYAVSEHRITNGLRALLLESHATPVVCVSIWYRAGSRNDPAGKSGLAHLLEHMMFKGTTRHPRGEFDHIVHVNGASNNATTWYDRTNYYELIGSDRYRVAVELEADRMRGALLTREDLEAERSVVRNELARGEDDPATALFDRLHAIAFLQHPYRRPVIGWREEVETIDERDLRAFYDLHYQPGNAFVVAAGDFAEAEMMAALEDTFGTIAAFDAPSEATSADDAAIVEPPQRGERRFELRKAGRTEHFAIGYRAPGRSHPDSFALDIIAQVLGHGRTARLYRRLVETGLAVDVDADNQALAKDPFLFFIEAEPAREAKISVLEDAIDEEIARLAAEPVSEDELARARKQARVDYVMRQDSVSALTFLIGELEIATGWQLVNSYLDRLAAVTPEDIMAAARAHLIRDERTVAHFRPLVEGDGGRSEVHDDR